MFIYYPPPSTTQPRRNKIPVVKYSNYIAKYKEYLNLQKEISMNRIVCLHAYIFVYKIAN